MGVLIIALTMYIVVDGTSASQLKNLIAGTRRNTIGIINGSPGNIEDYPYMAMYRPRNDNLGCGAVIVHDQFLLTAAHCVLSHDVFGGNDYRITVGSDKNSRGEGEDYEIDRVMVHNSFFSSVLSGKVDYDVALIKLQKKLTFNDRVKAIKMADSNYELKNGDVLTTLGFGMKEDGMYPSKLLTANVTYIDKHACQEMYDDFEKTITRRMLCTVGSNHSSSCFGDSGSPIVHNGTVVGVTSWGNSFCGSPCDKLLNWPTVYARLSELRLFIDFTIKMYS